MKTPKLLLALATAALALAHVASGQTPIYLSGAPATRAIWNKAIYNTLVAQTGGSASIQEYFTGSSYASANQIVLTGGTIAGNAVTIYGSWTGSTGGNQSVANTPPATIPALKVGFISLAATTGTGSTVTSNTNNFEYPQVNLSDTQQTTIPFNGTTSVTTPTTSYDTLTEPTGYASPAVTGFEFLTNKGAPSTISNLTTNLAQVLFTDGSVPLALFSGTSADQGTNVYAVGRDIASGARYILLAETGIGTANSDDLIQYEPAVTSGTITNISNNLATSGTINLISPIVGNGGYPSFSAVETVLSAVSASPSVGYIVTYVTDSDAVTAEAAGATALTWNGVPYSVQNIQQGAYTYWSFLHVFYNNTGNYIQNNFPLAYDFANDLAADLKTDTTDGAILSSSLAVARESDGGLIAPKY